MRFSLLLVRSFVRLLAHLLFPLLLDSFWSIWLNNNHCITFVCHVGTHTVFKISISQLYAIKKSMDRITLKTTHTHTHRLEMCIWKYRLRWDKHLPWASHAIFLNIIPVLQLNSMNSFATIHLRSQNKQHQSNQLTRLQMIMKKNKNSNRKTQKGKLTTNHKAKKERKNGRKNLTHNNLLS